MPYANFCPTPSVATYSPEVGHLTVVHLYTNPPLVHSCGLVMH